VRGAVEEKDGHRRVNDGHHTAALPAPVSGEMGEGGRGRVEAVGTHQRGNGGEGGRRCAAHGGDIAVVAVTLGEIESGEQKRRQRPTAMGPRKDCPGAADAKTILGRHCESGLV